jgi:hypothetical protein
MRAAPALNWKGLTPVYVAVVVLGSIVAHLASEFFAMGSEADTIALSPKHLYLGLAAILCAAFAIARIGALVRASDGWRDLKRELQLGMASLPFRGRGVQFYALTAALQLGVGLGTQIGEGCPFCGHDVLAGVLGAMLMVVVLACAGWAVTRRLPSLAAAIESLFVQQHGDEHDIVAARDAVALEFPRFVWSAQLYNRPPPLLSTVE